MRASAHHRSRVVRSTTPRARAAAGGLAGLVAIAGVLVPTAPAGAQSFETIPNVGCPVSGGFATCTYYDSSNVGQFMVPANITALTVTLVAGSGGAGGGNGTTGGGGTGGAGGTTTLTVPVTPSQLLDAYVGGQGSPGTCDTTGGQTGGAAGTSGGSSTGYAGGSGGISSTGGDQCSGGGGGGASFLLDDATGNLLQVDGGEIVAAGGGGGGGDASSVPGGAGSGNTDRGTVVGVNNGDGSGSDPGYGGDDPNNPGFGPGGGQGTLGSGGQGATAIAPADGGGGGGGGFFGGGGGNVDSGGGGGGVEQLSIEGESVKPGRPGGHDRRPAGHPPGRAPRPVAPAAPRAAVPAAQRGVLRPTQTPAAPFVSFSFAASSSTGNPPGGPPNNQTTPHTHAGSQSSNDPGTDASNDPAGENVTTQDYSSRTCDERVCSVGITLPDATVAVTAIDDNMPAPTGHYSAANLAGSNHPVLFADRDGGGAKPACPGYQDEFTDWVQFGFKRPERGADYRKTAVFTLRHPVSRSAAAARARKLQICFEAPYLFAPRPGYGIALHDTAYDGVLPECRSVRARPDMQTPCVATRKAVHSGNGWVVQITFRIPAGKQDPKALG
jgi:hypothetical protein